MHTKLKCAFELVELDDSTVAIPVGNGASEFHGVFRLNDTAVRVFSLLKDEVTEDRILNTLSQEFDVSLGALREDIINCLTELKKQGVLS